MAKVGDFRAEELAQQAKEAFRDARSGELQIDDLVKAVQKDRSKAAELLRVDIKSLPEGAKAKLMQMIGEQLKGQIPSQLAKSLAAGNVATDILEQLMQRLANSSGANLNSRFGKAPDAQAARDMATDKSVPQQALRWTQFVQKVLHVPGARTQGRAGVASPKGEGTTLLELLGSKLSTDGGPGLRSPKLVDRGMQDLSPGQRAFLMKATFGEKLANELMRLGIDDPLQFVQAGALPEARAELALSLKMPRARLLGLLMRAELLKIGPGRNGELGIRPELLGPLRHAGLTMLGTIGVIKTLSREEMAYIYMLLRKASGGFAKAVKGGRVIVKRDLIHWSRSASRRPSEILLADADERGPRFDRADARELIQAWYMENLLWEQLAHARRYREELDEAHRQRVYREEQERQEGRRGRGDGEDDDEPDWIDDLDSELEYDDQRADNLMCFWITDFNVDPSQPMAMRRMYVCIDPASGAIIPQSIEATYSPAV